MPEPLDPPQRLVAELETEAMLGGYRIVVVEGPTDLAYLQQWLDAVSIVVVVVTIEELEFAAPVSGNRDRLKAAADSFPQLESVRFLIDRDLQEQPLPQAPATLLWTDFPALESYAVHEQTLEALLFHAKRMPPLEAELNRRRRQRDEAIGRLVEGLAGFLVPLFFMRKVHETEGSPIEFPEDLRKFRLSDGSDGLDIAKLIGHLRLSTSLDDVPGGADIDSCQALRPHAYGHDVARSLWAYWPKLRQEAGIRDANDLERLLLSLVRPEQLLEFGLFVSLRDWAS